MDDITYLNGVKIADKWYFFSGGTLFLPRKYYQKDIHTSLSFEKMKQLAIKEIYSTYLKKGANGEWEVNEKFFADLTSGAWCTDCKTQTQWDSAYLVQVRLNWQKRDYKEYVEKPGKLTTPRRTKLTTSGRTKLTTCRRSKLTT